ncbi:MAG: PAS domain S-box protein, partial [Melioribacteraceae bacterium]|nr:PAS domain S-box protein [Melioribacteraceae bacterium]
MSNEQNLNSGNLQDKVSSNILLNELPIGIILLDAELNTSFINNAVDSFDLSRHKSLSKHTGKNLIELLPNLLSKNDLNKLKKNESLEKQVSIETDEEGNEQIIWLRIIPLFDSGKENGFVLIIDKQKITNEILFERFPKFQPVISLVSKLSDAILITDTDGNILLMQTKESFTNVPFNSKKKNIFDAFKQVDLGELFSEVKSQNSVKIIRFEQQIARENISYKLKFVPVQDTEEKVRLIFILIDDETEEINNQRELSQKLIDAELQNEIISSIEHAIIRTDWEGGISYFNNAANNLFFITSDEKKKFIGRTVPIINKTFFNSIKEELTENNVWEGDLKYTRDNEDFKAISVRASQIEVNNEKSILFLFSDISHRAEMERELRMSEERYRLMVTNAREYICLLDPDGTIKYANPFFVENFDLSLEENFETNFRDLIDDSSLEASMKNFSVFLKLLKDEKELILNKNNGDKIFVIARFTPVLDFNGDVKNYNGILIDVTEKKDTEKNLLLIRSVFEASRDGVAVFKSRELILANDSFIEMFGYQSYDELS